MTSLCVAALFVVSLSLGGYLASREYTEQPSIVFGEDPESPDRVDITAWVTRVDVVNQTVAVTLADVRPVGTAATMVFGVFIMVLMLGLALTAALAAYFVVRYRQGLVFGAYSVMAALLFAMVPLRNAVPGDPPIGSVIDFTAFFIAEAVISVSLITSVAIGYRHQLEIDRGDRRP